MFFAPMFRPESRDRHLGAAPSPEAPLRDRIARYISAPLAPIEVRELPCHVSFREAEPTEWQIGAGAHPRRARSPTAGRRSATASRPTARSVCYIPDHEPGLGAPLDELEDEWISGFDLARDATLLHPRLPVHRRRVPATTWAGATRRSRTRWRSARRARAERLLLFHHDPLHTDDFLDACRRRRPGARWEELGGRRRTSVELATERRELDARTG